MGEIRIKFIACYCNAHARRQFYDLESLYPKEVGWVLDTYGKIWNHEEHVREQQMDDKARLLHHKAFSLPIMQGMYEWATSKMKTKSFEEHI